MKKAQPKNKSAAVVRKIVRDAVADTLADINTSGIKLKSWPELWAETRQSAWLKNKSAGQSARSTN